ncbi:MAG: exodeoxyribonuclease III [Kofleriaceae bacterium]|nr:exodeoxyribonuclease III [Kofleriaceae bacterium]MCL4224587.1 exodeoxyribonuclease III [Myxococcales bacterium]
MRIATWNVNSVRAREARVRAWLEANRPDVLCLQELKVEAAGFPRALFEELGYQVELLGQKSYNGVAIASRTPLADVVRGFGDGGDDAQARFLVATTAGVRVASLYVPNGQEVGSDKYAYKLAWLARLRRWLDAHADPGAPLALCADWNVALTDDDVHDPAAWRDRNLFSAPEHAAMAEIMAWGLTDCYRARHPRGRDYSWWDYQGISFFKDRGLRIDMILASPPLAARLRDCAIDREARKGKDASDHAPVVATFADA